MRVITLVSALIVGIAPCAMAGTTPRFERIDFPVESAHTISLLALNDRSQVLGMDCIPHACNLFLWTERDGRMYLGTTDAYGSLNNAGHVSRQRTVGATTIVEIWTEQKGWQLVPGMKSGSLVNDGDMIWGQHETLGYGLWTPKDGFFPFVWPQDSQVWLGGVNNEGARVGTLVPPSGLAHPMLWTPSTGIVDLGVLPGLPSGQASVINDRGSIGGVLYDATNSTARHVFFWTPKEGMQDLGECLGCTQPEALNKHGEMAGRSWNVAIRTYFWSSRTGLFDIGTLGGASASMASMNDRAEIVGESPNANGIWHAFYWSQQDGMVDLTPDDWGVGSRINNDGLIMGRSINGPCVWKPIPGR